MTRDTLIFLLIVLAAVGFIVGITAAGYYTHKKTPAAMPRFLVQVVTTVGGVLATNLGAVLGLSIAAGPRFNGLFGARVYELGTWLAAPNVPASTQLQIGAAWLYVIGLIAAAVIWGWNRFDESPVVVVPTLPELTRTLLGVMVGVLAVALGATNV